MSEKAVPGAVRAPFRYDAVLFGSGEVDEIVESLGRRRLRRIPATSREGRRLLNDGAVRLWHGPGLSPDKAPVGEVLRELQQQVEQERSRHPDDTRWHECCRQRLESIERWQRRYEVDH
ncbi:MAG: hypothetical protein PVF68_00640 [Acidobacteriota bacterium]